MDLAYLELVKKTALTALMSDDDLFEMLVFKGGNALDLIYKISSRASMDLDFSMATDFSDEERAGMQKRLTRLFMDEYSRIDLVPFDIKFGPRPQKLAPEQPPEWGGYRIEFKLADKSLASQGDNNEMRRRALELAADHTRTFSIDISKHEFCEKKERRQIENYDIYIYPPQIILLEKIRALCQQTEGYQGIMRSSRSARARDFFDIYQLLTRFPEIDLCSPDSIKLLRRIFEIKRVPLALLRDVRKDKALHETDYPSLKNSMKPGFVLEPFSFYFDFVVERLEKIPV